MQTSLVSLHKSVCVCACVSVCLCVSVYVHQCVCVCLSVFLWGAADREGLHWGHWGLSGSSVGPAQLLVGGRVDVRARLGSCGTGVTAVEGLGVDWTDECA